MFTDIHTHILHNIDDGPENFDQSKELLNKAIQNGTKNLIATPHFYATKHSFDERLKIAEDRFLQLKTFIEQNKIPVSVLYGFEVRFFEGISRVDSLAQLSINKSKILLLELEPMPITEKIANEILDISCAGYTVVLAHIERYVKAPGFKLIKSLINDGEVFAQSNASSFISGSIQRQTFRLLKEGLISFVASDMHSLENRPPNLMEAYDLIQKKFGSEIKEQLVLNSQELFNACLIK
jgi:protein-tyrosine phosphatase